jgi:predicted RNase H-like HicB family nuclease
MFAEYLQAAMSHAVYGQFEDGSYFGSIPGFRGVIANELTLEATQRELTEVLEDWILYRISEHLDLPEVDGHTLAYAKASV